MALTNDIDMPTEEELNVPQEITLSTPWLKAVAPYMARHCEDTIKEFMQRRKEAEDPRKTLKHGAAVTACGIDFLRTLKKTCLAEAEKYAHCIDHGDRDLYVSRCRHEQLYMDKCVEEKLGIVRPPLGYFSKIHVHDSLEPPPTIVHRDYKAEAAKVLHDLPEDYTPKKEYRNYKDWRMSFFSSD